MDEGDESIEEDEVKEVDDSYEEYKPTESDED